MSKAFASNVKKSVGIDVVYRGEQIPSQITSTFSSIVSSNTTCDSVFSLRGKTLWKNKIYSTIPTTPSMSLGKSLYGHSPGSSESIDFIEFNTATRVAYIKKTYTQFYTYNIYLLKYIV